MLRALLFDIDGTLTDTNRLVAQGLAKVYHDFSGKLFPEAFFYPLIGLPGFETMKRLGVPPKLWETFSRRWQRCVDEKICDANLFPEVEEVVRELHARGLFLGLITAKLRREFEAQFGRFPISRLFRVAVCADEVQHPKPYPEPLMAACEKLGVQKEEVLFVGDTVYDLLAARSLPCAFAFAKWGALLPEKVLDLRPEYVLERPRDLLALVEKVEIMLTAQNL
ncbi:HAD-IA family hydrolase [Thermatribacter velox]|jgi:HAD superfamily hydrolase (TIGR01549 family)|uniref:HAD-IA family hydrolase n=1 Tax=Thermatribacter velox TaxID=3039681 RepID=A0ABZ2YF96_9BACT